MKLWKVWEQENPPDKEEIERTVEDCKRDRNAKMENLAASVDCGNYGAYANYLKNRNKLWWDFWFPFQSFDEKMWDAVNVIILIKPVVPGAPIDVSAAPGDKGQAKVSFTGPASDGGSAIIRYTVTSNPGNIEAQKPSSPITVTGLTGGEKYTFTVTATNAVGEGPASGQSKEVEAPQ
jgi:hypothetical protein